MSKEKFVPVPLRANFFLFPLAQIVAFILHFFLTFLTIWSAVILRQRQLLHATYKLFMLSVFIHVREMDYDNDDDQEQERKEF